MLFTVGNTESYEDYFKRYKYPGKGVGGSVWQTQEEAQHHAPEGFSVYGVKATWRVHTEIDPDGGGWDRLVVKAPLVKISGA